MLRKKLCAFKDSKDIKPERKSLFIVEKKMWC